MVIFSSESDLLATVARYSAMVQQCIVGQLSFQDFCELYDNFFMSYALDGHESDEEERLLLAKYDSLIEPHRRITSEILANMCSDRDAELESYKGAGRFGSAQALERLRNVTVGA
jgi:hypothetical protein